MRKLCLVPLLASLIAIPPPAASPRQRDLDDVPSLVAVPSLPSGPSASAADRSDDASNLIRSSLAAHPLDHEEARDRVLAAQRGATRDLARQRQTTADPAGAQIPAPLEAIAACESGGNPSAVGGGGAYRGKYQFSTATWQALGGAGDPAAAPEAEQDRRAATLYAQSGASQWPACAG